ncbi:hypothetical protein PoB_003746500 [Plakobranchus ocellatus]|uniref:Uncharacterized protein n=1 Tax=Plakobranchus ocellatus TaxID=259542 RepID=A0AAV4ARP8_9GAST|nr:hypothetical protein PoB_003746500 [Plakobranchus ocellatus]
MKRQTKVQEAPQTTEISKKIQKMQVIMQSYQPHAKNTYLYALMATVHVVCTHFHQFVGVGGTVASESALRSAGTLLSRVRAPPPASWPDGGPESLRSPCCGLAIYKKQKQNINLWNCTPFC